MNDLTTIVGPDLRTKRAAEFCTSLGKPTSERVLQKYRARQPGDPGEKGPDFLRDAAGNCWYEQSALIAWVNAWKAARRFRQPGAVPANFSGREAA